MPELGLLQGESKIQTVEMKVVKNTEAKTRSHIFIEITEIHNLIYF
jgi:hypothetical protein